MIHHIIPMVIAILIQIIHYYPLSIIIHHYSPLFSSLIHQERMMMSLLLLKSEVSLPWRSLLQLASSAQQLHALATACGKQVAWSMALNLLEVGPWDPWGAGAWICLDGPNDP